MRAEGSDAAIEHAAIAPMEADFDTIVRFVSLSRKKATVRH